MLSIKFLKEPKIMFNNSFKETRTMVIFLKSVRNISVFATLLSKVCMYKFAKFGNVFEFANSDFLICYS